MKTSQHLAIAFGIIGGLLFLFLFLALCRFQFRKRRKNRASGFVDSKYEARLNHMANGMDGNVVVGSWGITPVAKPGPGGTIQYFNGWFGLDPPNPQKIGWSRDEADQANNPDYMRETNFSRASRRSRRTSPPDEEDGAGLRPNELGQLEKAEKGQVAEKGDDDDFDDGEVDIVEERRSSSRLSSRAEDLSESAQMFNQKGF